MAQLYLKGVYYDTESAGLWYIDNSGTYQEISTGGGTSYLVAEKNLNNDEILALRTNPVNIIIAAGENKVILPFLAYIVTNFSAGAYGNRTGASIQLCCNDSGSLSDVSSPIIMDSALSSTNPAIRMFSIPYTYATDLSPFFSTNLSYNPGGFSGVVNCPLAIADIITSGSGHYTGGDPLNTMKVVVHYIIVDVS